MNDKDGLGAGWIILLAIVGFVLLAIWGMVQLINIIFGGIK